MTDMKAPERISLLPDDGWSWCEGAPLLEPDRIEYVHADIHDATTKQRDELAAEVERLTAAHNTVCGALAVAIKRATQACAERDAALKEQDRLAKAWEAKHDYQVKQSKNHAEYFDKSQRRMQELVAERDAALARAGAKAADMRERAAHVLDGYDVYDQRLCCNGHMCGCQGSTVHQMLQHFIRALPIDPDGQAVLDKLIADARADGIREALKAVSDLPSGKTDDVQEAHEQAYRAILALINEPQEGGK